MLLHFSRVFSTGRILTGIALLALLAGCGKSTIAPQPTVTPTKPASLGETTFPSLSLLSSNPGGAFDLAGLLHFDIKAILTCAINYDKATNIVLATNRLTYDTGEIQQMAAVLARVPFAGQGSFPPLPKTLQRVSGDLPGAYIPNWFTYDTGFVSSGGCTGNWSITNIGQQPIQIAQIGIRFVTASQPNNYHYRLIDACSLPDGNCDHTAGGGPVGYTYTFHLKPGSKNTIVQGQATSQLSLYPGETDDVELIFLPANSSGYQTYSFTPELTVNTVNEQITLSLPQLTSTVSFITPGQLSCYQLHGNTFVSLDRGRVSYSGPIAASSNVLCI